MGCDQNRRRKRNSRCCFNPRTRVGCDYPQTDQDFFFSPFQSTHPRGVRHVEPFDVLAVDDVSIHAPAWGATVDALSGILQLDVSIHAPAWGATPRYFVVVDDKRSFNPRTRVGCDRAIDEIDFDKYRFQSTHPRGVRHRPCRDMEDRSRFQSTHPRGVRHHGRSQANGKVCFNPRTRVGCDRARQRDRSPDLVSIHAPAWGATITQSWR